MTGSNSSPLPNRWITHVHEDLSLRHLLAWLPKHWIWRLLAPDYGIDVELEATKSVEIPATLDEALERSLANRPLC